MGFAMYYMEDIVNYAKEYKNSQNEKTFVIPAKVPQTPGKSSEKINK